MASKRRIIRPPSIVDVEKVFAPMVKQSVPVPSVTYDRQWSQSANVISRVLDFIPPMSITVVIQQEK